MTYPETLHLDEVQAVTVVGRDDLSEIVRYDFFKDDGVTSHFSRLTNCHRASAKGSMTEDGEGVTVCRSCYVEVDPEFGAVYTHEQVEKMLGVTGVFRSNT